MVTFIWQILGGKQDLPPPLGRMKTAEQNKCIRVPIDSFCQELNLLPAIIAIIAAIIILLVVLLILDPVRRQRNLFTAPRIPIRAADLLI